MSVRIAVVYTVAITSDCTVLNTGILAIRSVVVTGHRIVGRKRYVDLSSILLL